MGRKVKFSVEEKTQYVLRCINGKDSINNTAPVIPHISIRCRQPVNNSCTEGIRFLRSAFLKKT